MFDLCKHPSKKVKWYDLRCTCFCQIFWLNITLYRFTCTELKLLAKRTSRITFEALYDNENVDGKGITIIMTTIVRVCHLSFTTIPKKEMNYDQRCLL